MADKKISALTALTAANVAPATDVVPIVDTSATETKKVTAKDLVDGALNGGTANGVLYLNGSKAATSGSALVFDGTNLGIGTANPGTFGKFASVAASGATSVYTGTGVQGLFISTNESTRVVRYDSSGSLSGLHAWGNGPTELMRLDTSGNLGIGTSSPGTRLHTNKASQTPGDTTPSGAFLITNTTAGAGCVEIGSGSSVLGYLQVRNSASQTYYDFALQPNGGNVGIGTSSPLRRLSVAGDAQVYNTAADGASNTVIGRMTSQTRNFGTNIATSSFASIEFATGTWPTGNIRFLTNGVDGTDGAGTERMRIDANGNIVAGASAALATTATNGFLYVPTCAGTPTGTPTAITGMAPIVVNTTNNKLYFYSGGAWRDAGP